MVDSITLAQMNGEYVMPTESGPAWREAFRAGVDMALSEESLRRTPIERLLANDRGLALVRQIQKGRKVGDGAAYCNFAPPQ